MQDSKKCAPDQSGWLDKLGKSDERIATVMRRLRYSDSPFLLSMWSCLLLNDSVLCVPAETLRSESDAVVAAIVSFYKKHRCGPHPKPLLELTGVVNHDDGNVR